MDKISRHYAKQNNSKAERKILFDFNEESERKTLNRVEWRSRAVGMGEADQRV